VVHGRSTLSNESVTNGGGDSPSTLCTHTRGSHIHVACRSVCDQDQESWSVKIILDRLITPFQGSWLLDSMEVQRSNIAMPAKYLRKCIDRLILVAQNSSWSLKLDWLLKKQRLLLWFQSQTLLQAMSVWLPLDVHFVESIKGQDCDQWFRDLCNCSCFAKSVNEILPRIFSCVSLFSWKEERHTHLNNLTSLLVQPPWFTRLGTLDKQNSPAVRSYRIFYLVSTM